MNGRTRDVLVESQMDTFDITASVVVISALTVRTHSWKGPYSNQTRSQCSIKLSNLLCLDSSCMLHMLVCISK